MLDKSSEAWHHDSLCNIMAVPGSRSVYLWVVGNGEMSCEVHNMSDQVTLLHSLSTKLLSCKDPKRYDLTLVCMKFNFLSQGNPSCNWDCRCWFIGWDDHSYTKTRLEWHACETTAAAQLSNQITSTGHVIPCGALQCTCVPWSAGKSEDKVGEHCLINCLLFTTSITF